VYEAVRKQFTDVETVNLTLVIATINSWNRISISLGTHSSHGSGVKA
jgi:alkylhydroperoxidase family enzyme